MTILFFARRFYPLIGGVEKHVLEISKLLIKKGHIIIVVTEQADNLPAYEILKNPGIKIYRIQTGKEDRFKKLRIWKNLWNIKDVIATADVVHCHDVFFWYLPFRLLFPNKKVFTTFHGYESFPISKKAVLIRKLSEKLSKGNICIGDFITKWYRTKASFVSYGAVDVGSKYKVSSTKVKNESAAFIGRLDDQTGILMYVKAVELVRKKFPAFMMTAAGDGIYKKKIAKKVKVTGFVNNPEKYLINAHFAFVSRYLAILEAFAAKRLVFAVYDNPVKEDYLKLAPFAKNIVIANTPEEMEEKISYFLAHPSAEKKLIENAYAWVKGQTWENMVKMYLKLWKSV